VDGVNEMDVNVSKQWNDWKWQLANRIESIEQLSQYVDLTPYEIDSIKSVSKQLRFAISPYYASLMDKGDPNCPLRKQMIPDIKELGDTIGVYDPKKEEKSLPVDCLFQLYPDRLVLYLTNQCPSYCRHCFRKRRIGKTDKDTSLNRIEKAIDYLKQATEIRDVLITGGDALMVEDERLDYVLGEIRKIDHVQIIRLGTRTLCTLPQRITSNLAKIIAKHHPVWINTQINHPKEITKATAKACDILLREGIPLGNQTVLLKGINDDSKTMKKLMHRLLEIRVRPYYIFHCHFVTGSTHFRTPLETGQEIIRDLQGFTTGFAVPRYAISTRIGKIPLDPNYVVSKDESSWTLRNYEGKNIEIPNSC